MKTPKGSRTKPEGDSLPFRFLVSGAFRLDELETETPVEILKLVPVGVRGPGGAFLLGNDGKPLLGTGFKNTGHVTNFGALIATVTRDLDRCLASGTPADIVMTLPVVSRNMWVFRVGWVPAESGNKIKRGWAPRRGCYVLERRLSKTGKRLDRGGPFPGPDRPGPRGLAPAQPGGNLG